MKLREFTVREFRSVWDSGPIKVDNQTTCLVGKNEAGKTALLTALYRTNPIIPTAAVFDEVYDYPKREVEDYRFAIENGDREEAVIVECLYELENEDVKAVSSVFGNKVLNSNTFKRETHYGRSKNTFDLTTDDKAARAHLADNPALADDLKQALGAASGWNEFAAALEAAEATEAVNTLKARVAKVREKGLRFLIQLKIGSRQSLRNLTLCSSSGVCSCDCHRGQRRGPRGCSSR
jgi:hypothetical protein